MPAGLIITIDSYNFYTVFSDFDLDWRSQSQHKAKPTGFIFSHTFELIRMKLVLVFKQFKLNTLIQF